MKIEYDASHDLQNIEFLANVSIDDSVEMDRVVIDYTDDGSGYGPPLGAGKIGLRQMQWTVAKYRDFRVHALHAGGN
jgi:hypothetical protein